MQWDNVTHMKIEELVDFEAQPFKVVDDEAMQELLDSIKTVGVLILIIYYTLLSDLPAIFVDSKRLIFILSIFVRSPETSQSFAYLSVKKFILYCALRFKPSLPEFLAMMVWYFRI